MQGNHRLRIGRHSSTGQVYVITTVTRDRVPLFKDFWAARTLIQSLRWHDDQSFTRSLCFVVMPDHLHWIFQLVGSKSLDSVMKSTKQFTTHVLNSRSGNSGPLWQAGYYDHAVREEEDLEYLSAYVIHNPIRAGLVEQIEDYPHWDSVWI